MKKNYLSLVLLLACYFAVAQNPTEFKLASKESEAYHDFRVEIDTPYYGLPKIENLISKIKSVTNEQDDEITALDAKNYQSLSFREKFTYHMIQPETYSQNCDLMPPLQDEQKKIFGQLPDVFGEDSWSERQTKFFLANRDSVITLMQDCITKKNRIRLNFKHVIVDVNAKEMIPLIISTYNAGKKDHDLLTVLMLLMKNNKYPAFLLSASYKKLYASKDFDTSYKAYLVFNTANETLIIKRATDFYKTFAK